MFDIKKLGTDVITGGIAGMGDQLVANWDARREAASATPIGFGKLAGTYFNYGVPIVAVLATGLNYVRGDMATRLVTIGGQLAGRQVTQKVTKYVLVKSAAPWSRAAASEAAARGAAGYAIQNVSDILV